MYEPLENYMKTYRKRRGFSQEEVAFLIGSEAGTTVMRHETNARVPSLETAILYQVILGAPVTELFSGMLRSAEDVVSAQAEELLVQLKEAKDCPRVRRKIESAVALMNSDDVISIPIWE